MIYFDNAATSYPKPSAVLNSTFNAIKSYSFNSGRGGYLQSIRAAELIYDAREKVGEMFGFNPQNIAFCKNCTEALNIAIKGSVKEGEHIIISSLEHNSVLRVCEELKETKNISYDVADFSIDSSKTVSNFESLITPKTALIVSTFASNAFGVCLPVGEIGKMCKKHKIRFVLDGAQGAGVGDINAKRDCIDILCAPGHKCLFGIMGSGFIAIGEDIDICPLMSGGTGSESLNYHMPQIFPDRLESGTLNNPGIISIAKGIEYINRIGREKIFDHELNLCSYLYDELSTFADIRLYTDAPKFGTNMPILTFNFGDLSSEKVASYLAKNEICVRAGYHCSPLAHKHFGTLENGAVRLSLGAFNTMKDCQNFLNVMKKL